ncbi:MAG: ATP-binding protein [Defluviitaleaceae bacterium]|nr:ATP-binding protein [Defluviitaleaceae bacterium]MCL2262395.1 ATP-binding protein [Defluviitaleaceae bacterium]
MIHKLVNNLTVKSRIVIIVAMVVTVATVALTSIRAEQIREQMNLLLEERLQGNANMTFGIFDTVGHYTWWTLDIATAHARRRLIGENYDINWQLVTILNGLNREAGGFPFYENMAAFDANLNLRAIAVPDGDVPDILMFPQYFEEIKAGNWVSPVFESPVSGQLQFMFTQPVMVGDEVLGFVALTGNTQRMEFFLREFIQAYDSFINIADRSGVIFFSTRPEAYTGRHVNDLGVIEAFGEIPMDTMFFHNSALTGIDKVAYVTHDAGLNWTIVSFFDADAVEDVYAMIVQEVRLTVTGIVLGAILIVLIIHRSLKPLKGLSDSAKEVARGNVDVQFRVKRNDEMSQVANAFLEIVRTLNILLDNFKNAENAMTSGDTAYKFEDSHLGGIYDEMLKSTNNIVKHVQESQRRAENASKAKSDFLSKMSHEIRTPMNAIVGMTELILRENLSPAAQEQATTIRQSGNHLLSIINDILDLSKVESGKLELANSEYLFHSTIQDVINIIKMRMSSPDVRFAVYMQHNIPSMLFGDEVRVRQVLLNILTNALKYTREGHFSLDVTGKKSGDTVMLVMKIRDTGLGIKPEDLDALFGEFNQFDFEKNRNVEGTGLGLAITKNLVELMGGSIDVTSVYGEGSEFTVTIPQKFICEDVAPHFVDKKVLLYCRTQLIADYIARSLADLRVQYEIPKNEYELQTALESGDWDFIFAEADLTYVAQKAAKASGFAPKIVMLSDSYDATYEVRDGQDFTLLIMPAYFISIVNVLNGRDADYAVNNQGAEQFIAPDAKILIVDDIATNLKVGEGLLKLYCVDVDTCLSGRDAIAAVMAEDYDLVLMDHMMPEMDGVETVKIIRKLGDKYLDIPIVALTANAIIGAREMFLENGFDDFLSKPIELGKLNSILSKWIPKEKQLQGAITQQPQEAPPAEISIDGVDIAQGISFCGGSFADYLEILSVFMKNGNAKVAELESCVAAGNISLYTTYVHAVKSASANIGASALSSEAKVLEFAGIAGNMDFITKNNPAFIANLKKLLAGIDEVISAKSIAENRTFDEDWLSEQLTALKAALASFDLGAIDDITESLQPYTSHPTKGETLDDILQKTFIGQYNEAQARIDGLL